MKLLRWAAAGASAYAIYRYSVGKKAKGEEVFVLPRTEPDDEALRSIARKDPEGTPASGG